jgi:GNAT superfamily N-acetyltransferase
MKRHYHIRRVESDDTRRETGSSLVRQAVELASESIDPAAPPSHRGECFVALDDKRIVGTISVRRPDRRASVEWFRRPEAAILHRMIVDSDHEARGCREALLEVAKHWARMNEYTELIADVPVDPPRAIDFLRAEGFLIVGSVASPDGGGNNAILERAIAAAEPHSDAWFSPHRGIWFASISQPRESRLRSLWARNAR